MLVYTARHFCMILLLVNYFSLTKYISGKINSVLFTEFNFGELLRVSRGRTNFTFYVTRLLVFILFDKIFKHPWSLVSRAFFPLERAITVSQIKMTALSCSAFMPAFCKMQKILGHRKSFPEVPRIRGNVIGIEDSGHFRENFFIYREETSLIKYLTFRIYIKLYTRVYWLSRVRLENARWQWA